jgi:hypothetical protein
MFDSPLRMPMRFLRIAEKNSLPIESLNARNLHMAGIIVFPRKDWYISGRGFHAMAAGVAEYLSNSEAAEQVWNELHGAVDSWLLFIDTADSFTPEMLQEFKTALELHIEAERIAGASQTDNPDLHEGYLARLGELLVCLDEAIKDKYM